MLSYETIGKNIKAARERRKLTQEILAEKIGITVRYYGKIERGEEKPPLERLAQISEELSVPIEALFAGALPYMDYTNRPPTDDTEKVIAQILYGCDKQRRNLILRLAHDIATLE